MLIRTMALLVVCIQSTSFAQPRIMNMDSCIITMRSVKYVDLDTAKVKVLKYKIDDIIKRIKFCSTDFEYPLNYEDRPFEMIIPKYLKELSYGYGNNNFYYSFNDSNNNDSLTCSVVVYYDFDGSYKRFFFNQIIEKKEEVDIKYFGSAKMYLFDNWRKFKCGKLFLDKNTFVFYCTSNPLREIDLRKSILTFSWK